MLTDPALDAILAFCAGDPIERVFLEDVARRGFARLLLGTRTVNTPSVSEASIFSASTSLGNLTRYSNSPIRRVRLRRRPTFSRSLTSPVTVNSFPITSMSISSRFTPGNSISTT